MAELKNGDFCPFIKKSCVGLQCVFYMKVAGYEVNSGKTVEDWGCAVTWLPVLLIENSGQQRQTGAAVESFRNEMVKANETAQNVLLTTAKITQIQQNNVPKLIKDIEE
jgi:hypothetical protein